MAQYRAPKHRLTVFLLRFLISKNEYERLEAILSPYTGTPAFSSPLGRIL